MGIFDILKTSDGHIPFLQILLGIIIGIIGTILYTTFSHKESFLSTPDLLLTDNFAPVLVPPEKLPIIPLVPLEDKEEVSVDLLDGDAEAEVDSEDVLNDIPDFSLE